MKITTITIENVLGIAKATIEMTKPVLMLSGVNGAGKSSIRDAVYLALTDKRESLRGYRKKGDWGHLVGSHGTTGYVEVGVVVKDEPGVARVVLPKGVEKKVSYTPPDALPYVLEAQRFARLDETERRRFLNDLMGVSLEPAKIEERLLSRGCAHAKVKRVLPMLKAGMDPAATMAREQATAAKGAWRQITGETYGEVKAETWKAAVPDFDDKVAVAIDTELKHADTALRAWNDEVVKLREAARARQDAAARKAAADEHAARLPRIRRKLEVDEENLKTVQADIEKAEAAAGGGPRVGLEHVMARALQAAQDETEGTHAHDLVLDALAQYVAKHGPVVAAGAGDAAVAAKLPALRASLATCTSAVANTKRDLEAAVSAEAQAKLLAEELAKPHDDTMLQAALANVETITRDRAKIVARADEVRSARRALETADEKTREAAERHFDVLQWTAIADALSPDGIPADLLKQALGPINERLEQDALDANWPVVRIAEDMQILVGPTKRPYQLWSESEQWRCDAMIAEAVAFLSGLKLLVLDRFDLLDKVGREELLTWLEVLASNGEVDCALVMGTTNAPMELTFPSIATAYIRDGVVSVEAQPAAAG